MNLTFETLNLREGGVDAGDDSRLRRQLTALAAHEPTVVALQECKNWGDLDHYRYFHRAERYLGMRGYLGRSAHHGCHLAVFIRDGAGLTVIEQRHEHGHPYWHGFARVVVMAHGWRKPLHLVSVHLAPSAPTVRLAEAEAFKLLAGDGGAVIAGGDWNALPASGPEPDPVPGKGKRHKLDRRAAQVLEEAGFLDVGACAGDLTPTVGHFGPDKLVYRCDVVKTTLPAETITGNQVLTELDGETDHRPAFAAFDLTQAPDYAGTPGQR
jgi:endonuclease/exonuclease/phosphatase family metal-dependent hydrolase